MKMRVLSVALCTLLLQALSSYCAAQTIYITPTSSSVTIGGYGKKGQTIKWYATDNSTYTITFNGAAPCKNIYPGKTLTATHDKPATCILMTPKGSRKKFYDFQYSITPDRRPAPPQLFEQHVGSCKSCPADNNGPTNSAMTTTIPVFMKTLVTTATSETTTVSTSKDIFENVSCKDGTAQVTDAPIMASTGADIYWTADDSYKLVFSAITPPCKTTPGQTNSQCHITGSSNRYYYAITVNDKHGTQVCKNDKLELDVQ